MERLHEASASIVKDGAQFSEMVDEAGVLVTNCTVTIEVLTYFGKVPR